MTERQAGLSALGMAYMRAYHATHDSPKIFDDFLAASLFSPEELEQTGQVWAGPLKYIDAELAATNPDPETALACVVQRQAAVTLGRSRYTEDRLEKATKTGSPIHHFGCGYGYLRLSASRSGRSTANL